MTFMLDGMTDQPFRNMITGERREKETLMRRSEEGGWKRICQDTSLAAYPTARRVWGQAFGKGQQCTSSASHPTKILVMPLKTI